MVPDDGKKAKEAFGTFGRLTGVADLPSKAVLARYVNKAMELTGQGIQAVRPQTGPRTPVRTPMELTAALASDAKACATWEALRPSHRREYAAWIG